jgi:hypothetical protein
VEPIESSKKPAPPAPAKVTPYKKPLSSPVKKQDKKQEKSESSSSDDEKTKTPASKPKVTVSAPQAPKKPKDDSDSDSDSSSEEDLVGGLKKAVGPKKTSPAVEPKKTPKKAGITPLKTPATTPVPSKLNNGASGSTGSVKKSALLATPSAKQKTKEMSEDSSSDSDDDDATKTPAHGTNKKYNPRTPNTDKRTPAVAITPLPPSETITGQEVLDFIDNPLKILELIEGDN